MAGGWGGAPWGSFPWGEDAAGGETRTPDASVYLIDCFFRTRGHVRFSNRACEIISTLNWTSIALGDGATALWMLDDASGVTSAVDSSINGFTLAPDAGTGIFRGTTGPLTTRWARNTATTFPGGSTAGFSITPGTDILEPRTRSCSFEVWARFDASPPGGFLYACMFRGPGGGGCQMQLTVNTTNDVVYRYDTSAGQQTLARVLAFADIVNGYWHHIVGVRDVGVPGALLYIDSDLVGSGNEPSATPADINLSGPFYLGRTDGVQSTVDGDLFGAAWYDFALTPEQVMRHYLEGTQGPFGRHVLNEYRSR